MICVVIEKISPCLKAYSFSNSLICTASLLSWSCFLMNSSFSFFISLPDLCLICLSLPLLPVLQSPWLYNHMLGSGNIGLSSSKPTFLSSCCLEIFFSAFRADCFWFWTATSLLLSFINSWLWPGTLIRKSARECTSRSPIPMSWGSIHTLRRLSEILAQHQKLIK